MSPLHVVGGAASSGHIARAALDVFSPEPLSKDSPLLGVANGPAARGWGGGGVGNRGSPFEHLCFHPGQGSMSRFPTLVNPDELW